MSWKIILVGHCMLLLSVGTALPTRSSFLSTLISFTLSQSLVTYESMKTRNSQARNYLARKLFFLLKQNGTITKWQFEIRTKRSFMIIYSSWIVMLLFFLFLSLLVVSSQIGWRLGHQSHAVHAFQVSTSLWIDIWEVLVFSRLNCCQSHGGKHTPNTKSYNYSNCWLSRQDFLPCYFFLLQIHYTLLKILKTCFVAFQL